MRILMVVCSAILASSCTSVGENKRLPKGAFVENAVIRSLQPVVATQTPTEDGGALSIIFDKLAPAPSRSGDTASSAALGLSVKAKPGGSRYVAFLLRGAVHAGEGANCLAMALSPRVSSTATADERGEINLAMKIPVLPSDTDLGLVIGMVCNGIPGEFTADLDSIDLEWEPMK